MCAGVCAGVAVCLFVALWCTGDLPRVYPTSHLMISGNRHYFTSHGRPCEGPCRWLHQRWTSIRIMDRYQQWQRGNFTLSLKQRGLCVSLDSGNWISKWLHIQNVLNLKQWLYTKPIVPITQVRHYLWFKSDLMSCSSLWWLLKLWLHNYSHYESPSNGICSQIWWQRWDGQNTQLQQTLFQPFLFNLKRDLVELMDW